MELSLIAGLERIRRSLCSYPGDACDCKFGANMLPNSEQTGCPELRIAIESLRRHIAGEQPPELRTLYVP